MKSVGSSHPDHHGCIVGGGLAFEDKPFCEKMVLFFGRQVALKGYLSKNIEWSLVWVKGKGTKTRHYSRLDKALVVLDNGGVKDLVINATFCMKGVPSDSLYMFPADRKVLEQASWQDLAPLLAAHDKFERTGSSCSLTTLPMAVGSTKDEPTLRTAFTVYPFIMEGKTYIVLGQS